MALEIKKSDLIYTDYSWEAVPGDNPQVRGKQDRDKLSRKEGYEVLDFINHLLKTFNLKKMSSAHKLEKMIAHDVPKETHVKVDIEKWIYDNWEVTSN